MKKIVIFRTDRIGEVLLSTVAIDAVKRRYPAARVSFVTSEYSRPVLEARQDIEKIFTVGVPGKGKWLLRMFRLVSLLRKNHFDMAIVLNPRKDLHLACFLTGIPVRAGYDRKWGGIFLNRKIPDERGKGEKHECEYTRDLLDLVGAGQGVFLPHLFVSRGDEKTVAEFMQHRRIDPREVLIAVHPGSSNSAKIWPHERYAELIRRLKTELGCRAVVFGSREESALVGKIALLAQADAIEGAGVFDLGALAAFLKKTVLFVGNDTGPMHMAAALGVPVIGIFGRNIPGVGPVRWGPCGEGHVVFHEDPGCEKCHDAACPHDYKCLRAVTVDEVFNAARKIVKRAA
ncbi:MAG: lipopolysaccharide heptosyltransferase II [Candidatus Omnitrophota bacterium]